MIFGMFNPEKIWHEILQICPLYLWDIATLPWEIQKKSFSTVLFIHTSDYLCYLRRDNPTPTESHHTNLWVARLFHLTEGLLHSFKRWWLWREPVVMCGNWNVRQAVSQQVFIETTFCINTCFQSFSTLISRIVHYAVLKFSPCRNKPLPQASTCPHQYTCSWVCPRRSTRAMQTTGSTKQQQVNS